MENLTKEQLIERINSLEYQLRQMERAMESIKAAIGHAERDIKREQTK